MEKVLETRGRLCGYRVKLRRKHIQKLALHKGKESPLCLPGRSTALIPFSLMLYAKFNWRSLSASYSEVTFALRSLCFKLFIRSLIVINSSVQRVYPKYKDYSFVAVIHPLYTL